MLTCMLAYAVVHKHSHPHPLAVSQFDKDVLDACIYILDAAHMPIKKRADLLSVIRKASAMVRTTSCLQHLPRITWRSPAWSVPAWSGHQYFCFTVCFTGSVDLEDRREVDLIRQNLSELLRTRLASTKMN